MFEHIENLELIEILQGVASVRRIYRDRPYHALILRSSGSSRYDFGSKSVVLEPGKILFVPQGADYLVEQIEPGQYLVLNFCATLEKSPQLFELSERVNYRHLCDRLRGMCVVQTAADRYRCYALFYEILSYISEEKNDYHTVDTVGRLEPAIRYLKEHLFDPDLYIGRLHERCGMSDTYFRRLFFSQFGQTPKKYVSHQRLIHARAMIEGGEYDSIAQVAQMCGFDDPLYFSKVYKNQYGHAPTK
jgi:AraC-like DNA-binding protein